mmetsp:Transcript_2041/g.3069  ORF Transcript_2041/g.3069 Transcript_2041/m.3069 type:complete len:105 (-) Transcript_2041:52-366(-)
MFGVKEDATQEQIQAVTDGLLALPGKIPQIKSYEVGVDLKLPSGQNHPAGKNRVIVWTADFASEADYEVYGGHPDHVACITNFIKPIMAPGSRAAIQYRRSSKL